MEVLEVKGWIAYADAIRSKLAYELAEKANKENRTGKTKNKNQYQELEDSKRLTRLRQWLNQIEQNPILNTQTVKQDMKNYLELETKHMSHEELVESIKIRINSLLRNSIIPQEEGTDRVLHFNKEKRFSPGYVDTIYLPKTTVLINNSTIEIEAEMAVGNGNKLIDITIAKEEVGVYTLNVASLKDEYRKLVKDHNYHLLRLNGEIFRPFKIEFGLKANQIALERYFTYARKVVADEINNHKETPYHLSNLISILNRFDNEYIESLENEDVEDLSIALLNCSSIREGEMGQAMRLESDILLSNMRSLIYKMAQEGAQDQIIELLVASYLMPIIDIGSTRQYRITVPIFREISEGVFITQETNLPSLPEEIGKHILAEPLQNRRLSDGTLAPMELKRSGQGVKIVKQELNLERQNQEIVNEIFMSNEDLKKYIRRRSIETEIKESDDTPELQKQILTQISIEEDKDLDELREDPKKLIQQILLNMHTILTSVENDTRRLSKFYGMSTEHYTIEIDDSSIYEIAPMLLLIDNYLGGHGLEYTDVAKEVESLSDAIAEEFLGELLKSQSIKKEEKLANNSEIMKLADEVSSLPRLVWGNKSKVGYENYLNNLINMITHKSGSSLTRKDLKIYLEVFEQVLNPNKGNLNDFYYYETSDISIEDIDHEKINMELFNLNAHLGLVCQKTGFLKDVGYANTNHLNSYDLKKIPSTYLTLKALENTMDIDIIRDYNLMQNIIQKHQSINKDSNKIQEVMVNQLIRFFNRQISSNTLVRNLLQKVGLHETDDVDDKYLKEIDKKLMPFNEVEKYLILFNATKFSDVPGVDLQQYYMASDTKPGVTTPLEDIIKDLELLQVKLNSLSQIPPLISYETILPEIMKIDKERSQLLDLINYVPVKKYSKEEIDKVNSNYLKFLSSQDRSFLKEVDYELVTFENLTIYTPELKGEFSTQALQEKYEKGYQPVNIELLFGKPIEEDDFNNESPESYMLELLSNLPEGEKIYLPYEFRKKLFEFADSTVDNEKEDGRLIRDKIVNLIQSKVTKNRE